MPEIQLQEYLFQKIREKLQVTDSLADVVSELLFVSNDSAYRRIRGETPLVLEEAKVLCKAFSISLDEVLNITQNSISFLFTQVDNNNYSFKKYLQDIHANLTMITSAEQKELIYLAKDMPIFYNFLSAPLFAFRYFFWMKSILQHPDFVHAQFAMDILPKDIADLGTEINQLYNAIPSTEIWNTECVNSTISQIEYYREAGYFSSEHDIEKLYGALRNLVEHLRERAELGCKFLPGENASARKNNFNFFYNRVVIGENTIMASINGKKTLYLSYDVLNYLVTQDEKFCNETYAKLQTLMKRATMLSNASEKQRNIFFNILLRKIPNHSSALTRSSL
jgi:hypothetical protein